VIRYIESEYRCLICGKYSARPYCRECARKSIDGHCGRLKRKIEKQKKKWKDLSKNDIKTDINFV